MSRPHCSKVATKLELKELPSRFGTTHFCSSHGFPASGSRDAVSGLLAIMARAQTAALLLPLVELSHPLERKGGHYSGKSSQDHSSGSAFYDYSTALRTLFHMLSLPHCELSYASFRDALRGIHRLYI
jgi:hypothetical protein